MLIRKIDDLLTLLALTIFVDKRVFAEEIQTFMTESKRLQSLLKFEPRLTEARLLSWFETHREDLKQQTEDSGFEAWIIPLLERLKPIEDKTQLLDVMHEIAVADGEMHDTEINLITIAAYHWNVDYSPSKPPS